MSWSERLKTQSQQQNTAPQQRYVQPRNPPSHTQPSQRYNPPQQQTAYRSPYPSNNIQSNPPRYRQTQPIQSPNPQTNASQPPHTHALPKQSQPQPSHVQSHVSVSSHVQPQREPSLNVSNTHTTQDTTVQTQSQSSHTQPIQAKPDMSAVSPALNNTEVSPVIDSSINSPNVNVSNDASTDLTASQEREREIVKEVKEIVSSKGDSNEMIEDTPQELIEGVVAPTKKPFSSQSNVNSKMFFGTRYEVKCDETFAYYEGYVFDYDEKEQKLKVSYPWKPDQSVPVNYVRPVAPVVEANWKPKQGDHVECQAKAEESEPYGWWDCTIKTVRDNLYLITYEGWDNHHEVLQHNMLRPYNEQEPFSEDDPIVRDYLKISPLKVKEFQQGADMSSQQNNMLHMFGDVVNTNTGDEQINTAQTTFNQLKRIAKQTSLVHLNFSPTENKLILIGQKQKVRDAKMLIKFVWDLRVTYKKKEEGVKMECKARQKEYDELKKCETVRFEFNVCLTKYVIGMKGDNIQKAKQISQVKHINVRNINETTSECLILATDSNAAEDARNILEMCQDNVLVPKSVRKELIGKDGHNIQQLEERSHVIKISTLEHLQYVRDSSKAYFQKSNQPFNQSFIDEEPAEDRMMDKLVIIGPKEKVPFAKMLIQQQVDSIMQKRSFIERQNKAKQEINSGYPNEYDENYYYDQGYDQNYNGQSARRQRRSQKQTQMSNKDTNDFNYTTGAPQRDVRNVERQRNMGSDFPTLGMDGGKGDKGVMDSKDMSEETHGMSWVGIDEQGTAEDEQERDNDTEEVNERGQRNQYRGDRYGGRGKGRPFRGNKGYDSLNKGYDQPRRTYSKPNKPVWKAKQPSNTDAASQDKMDKTEANTSDQ